MSLIPKIGLPKGGTGSFLVDGVADGETRARLIALLRAAA